jgi:hypothetical protein
MGCDADSLTICDCLLTKQVFHVGNHTGNDFVEFFYEALIPWVHYIPVREDMSDLEEKLAFATENDAVCP